MDRTYYKERMAKEVNKEQCIEKVCTVCGKKYKTVLSAKNRSMYCGSRCAQDARNAQRRRQNYLNLLNEDISHIKYVKPASISGDKLRDTIDIRTIFNKSKEVRII